MREINSTYLYTNNQIYPAFNKNDIETSNVSQVECVIFDELNKSQEETEKDLKDRGFNVIAHRGYDKDAPENTLSSFQAASDNGYSTIEFDVEWTKDGVPVILHDKTINRTARKQNGDVLILPRKCSNMNYSDLLNYDFGIKKGEMYKGEKIPTFDETVSLAKDNDLNMYIELKNTDNLSDEKIQLLVNTLSENNMLEKVTWISFNVDYLKKVSDICPNARLGYLTKKNINNKTIDTLNSLKTENNEVFLDAKASKLSSKAVNLLKKSGFGFEAWDVDDVKTAEKLKNLGCSAITTDSII